MRLPHADLAHLLAELQQLLLRLLQALHVGAQRVDAVVAPLDVLLRRPQALQHAGGGKQAGGAGGAQCRADTAPTWLLAANTTPNPSLEPHPGPSPVKLVACMKTRHQTSPRLIKNIKGIKQVS